MDLALLILYQRRAYFFSVFPTLLYFFDERTTISHGFQVEKSMGSLYVNPTRTFLFCRKKIKVKPETGVYLLSESYFLPRHHADLHNHTDLFSYNGKS